MSKGIAGLGLVLAAALCGCGANGAKAGGATTATASGGPATTAATAANKALFATCMDLITRATADQPYYPAQHPECGTGSAVAAAGDVALKDHAVRDLAVTYTACEQGRAGTTGSAHWVDPVCKLPWLRFVAAAEKAL
jgi:hypothetical protein